MFLRLKGLTFDLMFSDFSLSFLSSTTPWTWTCPWTGENPLLSWVMLNIHGENMQPSAVLDLKHLKIEFCFLPLVWKQGGASDERVSFLPFFLYIYTSSRISRRTVLSLNTCRVNRYRRFNVLGAVTKALNMVESQSGGMVADFRHLVSDYD